MQISAELQKVLIANQPPRYRRLEWLERWVEGTQYEGKPSWFDDGCDKPLWERAPCFVYPAAEIAAQSNVDLVLGEGRFPNISSKPSEDEADEDGGLDEDDSKTLDRFIREYHKRCQFKSHCREALLTAQGTGTAVALHGHRNGRPFADLIPAKAATPVFGPDGDVLSVVVQYPYLDEVQKRDGTWELVPKLFRRKIDGTSDITYQPADAYADGRQPEWQRDDARSVDHGLGFCPVVWYAFMKGCVAVNVIDGKAIHALLTNEIHQHDIALSQRHRCALLSEPQIWETGVDPGYNPTETGRTPIMPSTEKGGVPSAENKLTGGYGAMPKTARKKGPGYVWQYSNPETKVGAITIDAKALEAQEKNCLDLLHKLEAALGVVLPKPEEFKFQGQASGKSLELTKQRQLDRCDQYRDDFRDNFLEPSLSMQLRIAQKVGAALKVPGAKKAIPLLAKMNDEEGANVVESSAA